MKTRKIILGLFIGAGLAMITAEAQVPVRKRPAKTLQNTEQKHSQRKTGHVELQIEENEANPAATENGNNAGLLEGNNNDLFNKLLEKYPSKNQNPQNGPQGGAATPEQREAQLQLLNLHLEELNKEQDKMQKSIDRANGKGKKKEAMQQYSRLVELQIEAEETMKEIRELEQNQ